AARLVYAGRPRRSDAQSGRARTMNITFEGKRAMVTGANHGFGRAIAKAFAENGAEVFALDVRSDGLAETKAACGGRCETAVVDVTDRAAVGALVDGISK